MSRSPERISSYRRHFDGGFASTSGSSTYQVRVSSPSPTRRDVRHRSASYSRCGGTLGRRALSGSRKSRMTSSVSMGALCLGMGVGAGLDLDAASAENQEFLSTRTGERQEMVALNDRLAAYIEKVRSLESQNKLLETEIDALQNRFVKPSGLRMLYEEQLKELKRIAEQLRVQRALSIAGKEAMAGQLEMLKVKYEEAVEGRKKAELDIEAFRPDVDAATSARIALEKQLENLEVQLEFLQRVQKEEIEELMQQIYSSVAKVDLSFSLPDLASALKQIQSQYDMIAAKNLQEMDAWYKSKFHDLSNASTQHATNIRSLREEIAGYKKDIQNRERELEALKTRNEGLEAQIRDAYERHKKEEAELLERIEALKLDLKSLKGKIALLLREYQDLLNVKMALEIEITTYRKLIEGEDNRLTTMVSSLSLMGGNLGARMVGGLGAGGAAGSVTASGGNNADTTESYSEEQAVELTERKTVLIRTVKTEEDSYESDTQERTITISGAADDTA